MKRELLVKIFFTLFTVIAIGTTVFAQDLAKYQEVNQRRALTGRDVITEEFLQKAYENTLQRHPELFDLPLRLPLSLRKGEAFAVNDTMEFWAINVKELEYYRVTAVLKMIGTYINIWVEGSELANNRVTDQVVQELMYGFEESTPSRSVDPDKGIIELEVELFGEEPDFDGDGKSDILFLDIKDYYTGTSNLTFVAGFFNPSDQKTTASNANSNERDMLYLDTYPAINEGITLSTASHEYQHLIHFNYDSNEDELVNEGISQLAQTITGQVWDDPTLFFSQPDRSLTSWADVSNSDVLADYAKVQMFFLYLYEQFGIELIQSIILEQTNGLSSIEATIEVNTSLTIEEVLKNWFIANYINDLSVDPKYGYIDDAARSYKASLLISENHFPVVRTNEILNSYAAEYIKVSNGTELEGLFTSTSAQFVSFISPLGQMAVTDIPEGVAYINSDFGNLYNDMIFMAFNMSSSSTYYTFTLDSFQPYFIREIAYDDGNPDEISGSQRGILWAPQTPGYQWAVKFRPFNSTSTLLSASIYALSDSIVFGNNDYYLHVYDNTGSEGEPGNDLIEPVLFEIPYSNSFEWTDIDLTDYISTLSQYHDDFYVSVEQPVSDTNRIYIAVDNSTPDENMSWAYRTNISPTPGWQSFSSMSLGETSLEPFDLMFRVNMSYLDTEIPQLTAGFLQHPLFTEYFDIYLVGERKLKQEKIYASLTVGSTTSELDLVSSGSTGQVYVDNDVIIESNGLVTLNLRGGYDYSNITADTVITFNVGSIAAFKAGSIATPSGRRKITISAGMIKRDTKLSAVDGFSFGFEDRNIIDNSLPIGEPGTFGPNVNLTDKVEVNFKYSQEELGGRSIDHLKLCRLEDDSWIPLDGMIDRENGEVIGFSDQLGTFQIRWSDSFESNLPENYKLSQNYPNPFNNQTSIQFSVEKPGFTTVKVYSMTGALITTLISEEMSSGSYSAQWDGTNNSGMTVASGIYLLRMVSGSYKNTKKMMLIK